MFKDFVEAKYFFLTSFDSFSMCKIKDSNFSLNDSSDADPTEMISPSNGSVYVLLNRKENLFFKAATFLSKPSRVFSDAMISFWPSLFSVFLTSPKQQNMKKKWKEKNILNTKKLTIFLRSISNFKLPMSFRCFSTLVSQTRISLVSVAELFKKSVRFLLLRKFIIEPKIAAPNIIKKAKRVRSLKTFVTFPVDL